jgi:Oxidoreductase NAD-binding domain
MRTHMRWQAPLVRSADGLAAVSHRFTGLSWLFMGAANSDAKLYDDEIQAIAKKYPDQFRVDYALSREQKNKSGGEAALQAAAAHLIITTYAPYTRAA